jgi:hypothetical protein
MPSGRIAAQGHDVAHARLPVLARDRVDLVGRRPDAGQVRGRLQHRLGPDARHGRVRAVARRAAGAVGYRHEAGVERRQRLDRAPQALLHVGRLGREELEGDLERDRQDE